MENNENNPPCIPSTSTSANILPPAVNLDELLNNEINEHGIGMEELDGEQQPRKRKPSGPYKKAVCNHLICLMR